MYLCMSAVLVYPSTSRGRVSVCHLRRRVSVDPVWHDHTVVGRVCFDSYSFQSWVRNPLIAAVFVWLASLCCVCMCVVVCEYARTGMAICVYMCTEFYCVWPHVIWCMCLIYASGIIHCSSTWKWCHCDYISHLHFHLLIWIGLMESESWSLVTWDKVHTKCILLDPFPFPPMATTCKTSASGPVETIGGAVHVEGDAWWILYSSDTVMYSGSRWCCMILVYWSCYF